MKKSWAQQLHCWKQARSGGEAGQFSTLLKPCQLHSPSTKTILQMALLHHWTTDLYQTNQNTRYAGSWAYITKTIDVNVGTLSHSHHFSDCHKAWQQTPCPQTLKYQPNSLEFLDCITTCTATQKLQIFQYCNFSKNTSI